MPVTVTVVVLLIIVIMIIMLVPLLLSLPLFMSFLLFSSFTIVLRRGFSIMAAAWAARARRQRPARSESPCWPSLRLTANIPFIDPETIKMRVTCPRNTDIYRNRYLTRGDVASITPLREKLDKKFGRGGHTNTVMELPDEVRGRGAIPAVIAEILHQLDEGLSLEETRKQGMLDIGEWRVEILY